MIDEMMAAIGVTPITSIVSAHAAKPTMCDANTTKPNGFDPISGGNIIRHTGDTPMTTNPLHAALHDAAAAVANKLTEMDRKLDLLLAQSAAAADADRAWPAPPKVKAINGHAKGDGQ